jgi:hypothetical protein
VKDMCKAKLYGSTSYRGYQCANRAKYGDFCGTHSPEKKAERAAKRGPTWNDLEFNRSEKRQEVIARARDLCARFDGVEFEPLRQTLLKLDRCK